MNAKSPSISKHTPGPWKLAKTIGGNPAIESEHDQRFSVAIVPAQGLAANANARLIAAAPELLDFARMVVAGNTDYEELEREARAIIAKAEGGDNV